MKKILFVFLCLFSVFSHSEYLTSCESSLADPSYIRSDHLSDICWTRHGADQSNFIYWQALWDGSKNLTPVSSWDAVITAMDVEHANGWRLPTIKELAHLASPKAIDNSASPQEPGALSDYWMVQHWFNRQSAALETGLIPAGDNYILSSTYFEDVDGKKLMAININDGRLVKIAINADTSFNLSNIYVIKLKAGSPTWFQVMNQSAHWNLPDNTDKCLHAGAAPTGGADHGGEVKLVDCDASDLINQAWYYEENTKILRSYNGYCLGTDSVANRAQMTISQCTGNIRFSKADPAPVNPPYFLLTIPGGGTHYLYGVDSGHTNAVYGLFEDDISLWSSINAADEPERFNWTFVDI